MDVVRTIELPAMIDERLRTMAEERGQTPAELVASLVASEPLDSEPPLPDLPVVPGTEYPATPEAFRAAIQEARESIEREGTIPGEEVSAWLKALAAGENPPMPVPSKRTSRTSAA